MGIGNKVCGLDHSLFGAPQLLCHRSSMGENAVSLLLGPGKTGLHGMLWGRWACSTLRAVVSVCVTASGGTGGRTAEHAMRTVVLFHATGSRQCVTASGGTGGRTVGK